MWTNLGQRDKPPQLQIDKLRQLQIANEAELKAISSARIVDKIAADPEIQKAISDRLRDNLATSVDKKIGELINKLNRELARLNVESENGYTYRNTESITSGGGNNPDAPPGRCPPGSSLPGSRRINRITGSGQLHFGVGNCRRW